MQAGAARVTGDFRHCADNVFHLQHQPVGFAQGQTRRGDVSSTNPPSSISGMKPDATCVEAVHPAAVATATSTRAASREALQGRVQNALVAVGKPGQPAIGVLGALSVTGSGEPQRQQGSDGQRVHHGEHQGGGHGDGQGL